MPNSAGSTSNPRFKKPSKKAGDPSNAPPAETQAHLEKILASKAFHNAERVSRFLRFVVEHSLAGDADLKEYIIGVEVFGRSDSYDPRTDPIVRAEAMRLRAKLQEYYASDGRRDEMRIIVPKGTYTPSFQRRTMRLRRWLQISAAAVVCVLAMAAMRLGLPFFRPAAAVVRQPILIRLSSTRGLDTDPAISEDGRMLAYASDEGEAGDLHIWIRPVAGGAPTRLTHDDAEEAQPTFSPDGKRIAFRSDREGGGIYTVPLWGGEARLIAPHGRDPRFSPDGSQILYWVGQSHHFIGGEAYVVPSAGGSPRRLQPQFLSARYPLWSADGKRFLYWGARHMTPRWEDRFDWWVAPLDGGPAMRVGAIEEFNRQGLEPPFGTVIIAPGDWKADRIYFSARLGDSTNLWCVPISPKTWRLAGSAARLTFGTGLELNPSRSATGDVVFSSQTKSFDIWKMPSSSDPRQDAVKMQRLTEGRGSDFGSYVSADGRILTFYSYRSGNHTVWRKSMDSGDEKPVAQIAFPLDLGTAVLSPDGTSIAYSSFENERLALYVGSGQGTADRVCDDCGHPTDWSSDGQFLLYYTAAVHTDRSSVGLLHLPTRQKMNLLMSPSLSVTDARFSPDSRWIAFPTYIDPLHKQIFVTPFRRGQVCSETQWIAITDGSASDGKPVWSRYGNLLFFVSERDGFRCIMAQHLDPVSKHASGGMFPLQHFHRARFSLLTVPFGDLNLALAGDRLVFTLAESTGNIWLARQNQ